MKKKIFWLLLIVAVIFYANPVLAANIYSCNSSIKGAMIDSKIPELVSTIITVIKIAVPVLLVIFGMLDLMKGIIASKEEEIKKGRQIFIKRLIAGALVFLVFTIVQLIIGFVADEKDKTNMMTCVECFINGDCTYMKNANGSCPENTKLSDTGNFCIKK